ASLPLYAVLGCCAGLISILFTRSLMGLRAASKKHRSLPDWVKPGIGGLLTGMCAVVGLLTVGSHGVAGGGYAELSQALAGVLPITTLLALCVLKLGATVFSYSTGGTGGLFAPALFIGAMLGGSVGWLGHEILGYSELGEFALVGMGATFAGIIRAPITSVLIVFEMTDGYALVLPLMIATTISYLVAQRAEPHGLYDALLAQDGIEIPHSGQARRQLEMLRVADAMTASLSTLPADASVGEALDRVQHESFSVYPVVDAVTNRCAGLVDVAELRQLAAQGHGQRRLADVASVPAWVRPEDALLRAVVRMNETGARHLIVFEKEDRLLRGLLTRSDIFRAQAKTVEESFTERPPLSRERAI
ncbi:MAG TPA: chloride channel protein, partial [Polyangiaceae bacterium]|nr:chloride channel protein [Polyangiaceae bacterium]